MSPEASGERAIAADRIDTAITGDVSAIVLPPEILHTARDIQAPPGLSNLAPRPRCVGREDELTWLQGALAADGETAITQTPTVHGLGGIGKSTLALAYAHHHRNDYTAVWWINADSPASIERSLAALTSRLVPAWGTHATEPERAAWATTWLQWHPGWLLVFDNVEDPRDLTPYTGALTGGRIITTSRRATGWPTTISTRALGLLTPEEAARLLCERALDHTPTAAEWEAARALAADLGHLPLALEQAGAYLRQNPTITLDRYRRRLSTKLGKAAAGTDPARTIARVWAQTLEALEATNPDSVQVLAVMAWLAPDNIPISLLPAPDSDPDALDEALGDLHTYSMINLAPETASIHRLLQAVLRKTPAIEPGEPPPGRREAEQVLACALTDLPEDHPLWESLAPHLISLAATTPPGHVDDAALIHYERVAQRLDNSGRGSRSIALREVLTAHFERTLGDSHFSTLTSRDSLARAYKNSGDFRRAVSLLERTLANWEQALGATHHQTLASRHNLAGTYLEAGDLERAIPLQETSVVQCEQELGDTHPDTLTSRNNLASVYMEAGDLERAIPLQEAVLAQRVQVLGDTHPDTLISRNNLASAYLEAGDLERAIPLCEATLTQFEQVLGDAHPHTLISRNNLANVYQAAGDFERAIFLCEATLTQREQILGETHPHTLTSRHSLANVYQAAGDLERAIPLLELAVTQREQILGETHPHTLTSRSSLAIAYQTAGDLERAIPLMETLLSQCERIFGDTHPHTLSSRSNLVNAYAVLGDLERAVPLLELAVAQFKQLLGDAHPKTEAARMNLANARRVLDTPHG